MTEAHRPVANSANEAGAILCDEAEHMHRFEADAVTVGDLQPAADAKGPIQQGLNGVMIGWLFETDPEHGRDLAEMDDDGPHAGCRACGWDGAAVSCFVVGGQIVVAGSRTVSCLAHRCRPVGCQSSAVLSIIAIFTWCEPVFAGSDMGSPAWRAAAYSIILRNQAGGRSCGSSAPLVSPAASICRAG